MSDEKPNLNAAYALETPEDNRRLYADWAETYDDSFASDMDYQLPKMVGLIFCEAFKGLGPVLDVGAGTGLLAQNIPIRGCWKSTRWMCRQICWPWQRKKDFTAKPLKRT